MKTEFIKYFVVVFVGLVIDVGILYFLTSYTNTWYFLAAGISFTLALIFNYVMSLLIVFKHRAFTNTVYGFMVFASIGVSALGINQIVMYVGVDVFSLPVLLAKAIALPLTFSWNFSLNKFVLFRKPRELSDSLNTQ